MNPRTVNKVFLGLNLLFIALNALSLVAGNGNAMTVLVLAINCFGAKVCLDALKR